jgi:CDP-diacylglycerol--glycerol-3-phosphate 3-phosphatidyltransferase
MMAGEPILVMGAGVVPCQRVIDLKVRPHVQWLLRPIGKFMARIGITPTFTTLFGLAVAILGAVLIGTGRLALGAGIALVGSSIDGLDGSVARATGSETSRGAFLDSTSDRLGEVAAFAGLAVAMTGQSRVLLLIVLGVSGALMVPYLRARAEAEGVERGGGGLMGRAERVILLTAGLVFNAVEPMLWVMVVTTWFTVGQRFIDTWQALRK